MNVAPSLIVAWAEENNNVVKKWKKNELCQSPQDLHKYCYEECLKLHQKVQGTPALLKQLKVEISLAYNTLLFSLGSVTSKETKDHLINTLARVLEAAGTQMPNFHLAALWQVVLVNFCGTVHEPWIHKLLLIQWIIWLSECQFEEIHRLFLQINQKEDKTSDLLVETQNLALSFQEDASLLVVVKAKDLKELLHISTFIAKGVEAMKKENYVEALQTLQKAMTLPSPRNLMAHVHSLTGRIYTKLQQPQSALQCYHKALEVNFKSLRALYESSLVYRKLRNNHAEIEALRLLHSATLLNAERDSSIFNSLVSPDMLFGSEQMAYIAKVPSPLHILHSLGHACVANDRAPDGAEYYLELLAALTLGSTHVTMKDDHLFPRILVIYLEAAFAQLKAKRFWDALAICDEVSAITAKLVPERLHPMTTEVGCISLEHEQPEKFEWVIWSGASYFLQGQAHLQLKDIKEALICFTSAINHLMNMSITQRMKDSVLGPIGRYMVILEALKSKVLAFRGLCFIKKDQLREALRDFSLSLQASPGCQNTRMWLVEVMWRMGREKEAAALWTHGHEFMQSSTSDELPLYLQTWKEDGTHFDQSNLNKRIEEFIQHSSISSQ